MGAGSEESLTGRGKIAAVGVVTRDRLPSLVGCLQSYLENFERHGRSPEFVVVDDSAGDRGKAAVRSVADRFGARVGYAGRQEKARFAGALAAESAVPREVIDFALFGDERCSVSTGANRNSLLLESAGSLLLMVDDDTVCRMAAAPEQDAAPVFFSGYDPTEFGFFLNRSLAAESVSFIDVDVLGCHETQLGSVVGVNGRVAMTLPGLVGDSGMASPRYYLTLTGASRERLVASAAAYRSALESREVLRSVRHPTITAGPFFMSTFPGLDNRILLPPFFPVQRNSDGIFGVMMRECVDGSQVAFLPWIMLHAPEPPRRFAPDEMWVDAAAVRMCDIVIACVQAHEPRAGVVEMAARSAGLGKHLQELGSLDFQDFEAGVRTMQQFRNFAFITALQTQLQTYGASPSFWADDVSRMIELTSQASAGEDYIVPRDLRQGRDVDAARQLSRGLIRRFGELLEAWPAMVAGAKRLRAKGHRLATAL